MAQPRPLNLVTLPQYNGEAGSDPDYHLNRFNIVCAANMIPKANFLPDFLSRHCARMASNQWSI